MDIDINTNNLYRTKVVPMEHLTRVCLRCDAHFKRMHGNQSASVATKAFDQLNAHTTIALL